MSYQSVAQSFAIVKWVSFLHLVEHRCEIHTMVVDIATNVMQVAGLSFALRLVAEDTVVARHFDYCS